MLVLTAALVAPWFVDWTSYRADFEREASRVLGRPVNVRGRAEARLIPFPSVTFTDVTVAGDGGEPAMTVDRFSMDAELAPFLRGEVLIFDMRLERPKVRLAINADGAMDWAIRPEAPAGLSQVSLERLSVSDGELIVDHAASDGRYRISSIFAEMSARSLAGPWRFNGAMKANGQLVAVDASTGELGPDGRMRLHLTIEPARQKVKIEAEGGAYLDAARPRYAGTFTVTPRKETGDPDPAFTITVKDETISRLTGEFSLDHKLLAFDALRYESGQKADPYVAEGTGFIDLGEEPHFAVNMEGRQISLDEGRQGGEPVAWDERIAQAQALLDAIPQPAIPGTVDLRLPAVVAGGTTLRDIEISAEPIADGWLLHKFSAGLPGRSTLEADGALTVADGIAFNGNILLAVAQPSGLATWLTGEASEAVRRLGAAGFSGKADLSQDRQRLTGLELALGGETLTGSFERTSSGKSSPSLSLRLEGGALDGDRAEALAHVFVGPEGGYRFGEESLDLTLKAGPVTWQGFKAGSVDIALRARGDRIDVDRLSLRDLAGADVSATGVSSGTGSARKTNADISVIGTDLAPLAGLLAGRFPQSALAQGLADRAGLYPGLLADSNIDMAMAVEVKDEAYPATLSTRGVTGGTEFEAEYATPDAMAGFAGGKLSVKASNSDAAPVFAAYGLPALPLGLGGEVATGLQLAGRDDVAITAALTLTGPERAFAINGVWTRPTGGSPDFEGEAALSGKDLSPWLYALGIGVPGIELGLAADLHSPVRWDGNSVLLPELAGRIEDATVRADLAATAGAERPMLTGKLETEALDGGLLAGLLWGVGAATLPEGDIPWSDEAIAARDSYPADLDLALTAEKLGIGAGIDIGDASGQLSVGGGKARLSAFTGELLGGRVEGSVELSNVDGAGLLSVQGRLIDTDLDQLLPERHLAGRADIAASLSGSGKSQAAIASSLAGSGVVDLRSLVIDGLAPDPLPGVLADADTAGRDATQADFDRIIRKHALTGAFAARPGAFAFTVAGGVARSAPFALADRSARIDAKVSADIGARRTAGEAAVTWEAGDNAVAGSIPQIGVSWPSDSGGVQVDTAAMTQFLTQRALEAEQARVQAMQSALMEKQRLRREVRLYAALEAERQRKAEEEARREAEEEARLKAEEDARRLAEEEAKRKAEEEARRKAENAARQAVRDLQPENGGNNRLPLPGDPSSGAVPIQ